ncbi:hypothetical protein CI610_01632 [invertebrate metagenome]|uniref:Uncharacterized protein n=1 Tax=invertebrate metagenome TaxID=1711999 RepID=A0A2H9T820_9ZZZZ
MNARAIPTAVLEKQNGMSQRILAVFPMTVSSLVLRYLHRFHDSELPPSFAEVPEKTGLQERSYR